ncbi:HAMP domain-containing histidine kinase [Pseudomonas capsici]|uniref:sensor histidine kinase n=1 Tax=Pseudomonas capsici TaxID=2810614 RepID=UPI0021F15B20|nr:HAMP domain-containing histidine kinase [Pseudomonas capsici]MCV4276062.1 HAMP domain-containing histidine kinase [Pseudomonas capsici]
MILSLAIVVFSSTWALSSGTLELLDFSNLAEELSENIQFDEHDQPVGFVRDSEYLDWLFNSVGEEIAFRVFDEQGTVGLISNTSPHFWSKAPSAILSGSVDLAEYEVSEKFYRAVEAVSNGGGKWYLEIVITSRFMGLLHRVSLPLVTAGIILFSIVLFLAFVLCVYMTLRCTLRPLEKLSQSAMAISPNSLVTRLSADAIPSEIAPLVYSFNQVLDRLEHGYRIQREFLSNAAHELKTPLALIRAELELQEGTFERKDMLRGDIDYMSRQVQQLLHLAEVSESGNYSFKLIKVNDVVREVVGFLQRLGESANVQLVVSAVDDTEWVADSGALFTLMKNLLENAIQHSPSGTTIFVRIERTCISVRDQGEGVDTALIPLFYERFWRAPSRRDHGAGLGLSICKEIADAHGWHLTCESSNPGLVFSIHSSSP